MGWTVVRGALLSLIWGWFVAEKFGLPMLGLVDAIGLSIVVSLLTFHLSSADRKVDAETSQAQQFLNAIIAPGFFYLFIFLFALFFHSFQ